MGCVGTVILALKFTLKFNPQPRKYHFEGISQLSYFQEKIVLSVNSHGFVTQKKSITPI